MYVLEAPAKINLFLNVKKELTDRGLHLLESLILPVSLYDSISVQVFPAGNLEQEAGIDVHFDPELSCSVIETTVHKAVLVMRDAFRDGKRSEDFLISIQKRIPEKSGLGGGSSDAAAVILTLCVLWGLNPLSDEVIAVASSVGADVPFFLFSAVGKGGDSSSDVASNGSAFNDAPPFFDEAKAAYVKGIGDEFEYATDALNLNVVLVKNVDGGVSTAQAYESFDREGKPGKNGDELLVAYKEVLRAGEIPSSVPGRTPAVSSSVTASQSNVQDFSSDAYQRLFSAMGNNLEPIALKLAPLIQEVRRFLIEQDGVGAVMVTGSGSSVFGVCSTFEGAEEIAFAARKRGWWAEAVTTRCSGLKPILC